VCELLGINVSPAARLGLDFHAFRGRAAYANNHHGWGLAWYDPDGSPVVHKEAERADESALAARLAEAPPTSSTFIVHVRAATVGRVALANSHPFVRGRWTFAHNGTIQAPEELDTGGEAADGDTDSERAFLHLLHRLAALGSRPSDEAVEDRIAEVAAELSARGKCNFLLSDGTTLFGYYDGHKTLHLLTRRAADLRTITVADDEDYEVRLSVEDAAEERAVVLASVPLSGEAWTPLAPGTLVVCRGGRARSRSVLSSAAAR
jgi:predicted glutamine amidotransferase